MTQSEFIERVNQIAGITFRNATLSSWENGQSSPGSDLLPVISKILQTPVTYLLNHEEDEEELSRQLTAEEPVQPYASDLNTELYRKIFAENQEEGFEELLDQYKILLEVNEKLKAENQRLEGKLAASKDFLKQLMNISKG